MKTNTIDEAKLREILTRLLADVDDNMELAGTYWKTKDGAAEQVKGSLNEAVASVNALAADAVVAELEGVKRALNNLETAIELGDDARADLVVQQAVAAAWGVMKPQLIAQVDERIALKQKESE